VDYLVVRALSASEDAQLPLKNEEQLFDVAMFLAQNVNDHCALPENKIASYSQM
jgi:hypothetical protein